ncbi:MAG: hypothetical protein MJ100_06745 [Ruminococcus sp.]|nr:hypothetical protein [Ruminococcus sp.]
MKKCLMFITAAALMCCSFSSCEGKAKGKDAVAQDGNDYEEALKECFNASFGLNGGKIFYSYMYPDEIIDKMKADGSYDTFVKSYNEQQSMRPDLTDGVYEFERITASKEINEKQENAVKEYFLSLCTDYFPGMKKDDFTVGKGYEVSYSYLKNGQPDGKDTVLVISLNDQGWKIIAS